MAEGKGLKTFTPTWSLRLILIDIPVLIIAVILDILGVVCFYFSFVAVGIPLSYILDAIGIVIIGPWALFLHSGKMPITRKLLQLLKRFGPAVVGELIPFFGDIVFCWTIYVIYIMISDNN